MKTKILKPIILAVGFILIFTIGNPAQAKSKHKHQYDNYYGNNYYDQGYNYRNNYGYNYGYGNRYRNYDYYDSGYYYSGSRQHFYPADLDPSYGPYPGCWADPNANRIICDPGRN